MYFILYATVFLFYFTFCVSTVMYFSVFSPTHPNCLLIFFAISLIVKSYYQPQEFISVSSILDYRYYRWHLIMSLYKSKDLEIYNNFHLHWICHWILFAYAEKLLFFVVFFALLIFVLCLFSFSEVTFPFMAISLFVWLSSYSYSMSG